MSSRWQWGILCVLSACEPLPPEPKQNGQTPEFTVLSATSSIGELDFSITNSGHLEATLVLHREVVGQLGPWATGASSPIQVPAEHRVSVVASFGELLQLSRLCRPRSLR